MRDTPWSLYFSSHFARHFIEKEKSRRENGGRGERKKEREENIREHGCVRANNFVAEFALVQ